MSSVDRPSLGVALRILSGLLFAGMLISVKAVSEDVPLGEIVFFRSAFALIPLVISRLSPSAIQTAAMRS